MSVRLNSLILLLSIASVPAAEKPAAFRPKPAAEYRNHQTISQLTIAADAFTTSKETKAAFGKLNPNRYGVLPVLVVMQNDSDKALRLDGMRVEYIRPDHRRLQAVPAEEVRFLYGVERPKPGVMGPRYPIPGLGKRKKNPLAAFEIVSRAFSAKMLPPGDFAYGFFYFNTAFFPESILYVTGIEEAATGQELFYFEIPLE